MKVDRHFTIMQHESHGYGLLMCMSRISLPLEMVVSQYYLCFGFLVLCCMYQLCIRSESNESDIVTYIVCMKYSQKKGNHLSAVHNLAIKKVHVASEKR